MNPKFLHNLKLFCKLRKEGYETWLRAYKTMPFEVKKSFKANVSKYIKEYRQEERKRQTLDKLIP